MDSFYISIILFLILLVFAIFNKKKFRSTLRWSALSIILIDAIMLFSLSVTARKSPLGIFLYAFQIGTLNADFSEWLAVLPEGKIVAKIFFVMMCYLTPLVIGGALLSFFTGLLENTKYLVLRRRHELYYFSQLNNESATLAIDIKKHKPKALIVFLNITEKNSILIERINNYNFIKLPFSETEVLYVAKKPVTFFEISDDENKNLSDTMELLDLLEKKYKDRKLDLIRIFSFSTQEEASSVIVSGESKYLNAILVNRNRFIAHSLLNDNPLYNCLSDVQKSMNVLLIGCGKIGEQILKTILWCGQLGNKYKLQIKVIDNAADRIQNKLKKDIPEIFTSKDYDLSFFKVDVESTEFVETISEKCADSNYVVVCTNNDSINYNLSVYLRGLFLRLDTNMVNKPIISTLLTNDVKKNNIKYINKTMGYDIFPFGNTANVYSYDNLVNSELERVGYNVNSTYYLRNSDMTEKELRKQYYSDEISRQASRANALHYKYKLFTLGYTFKPTALASDEEIQQSKKNVEEILKLQDSKETLHEYSIIEHMRWTTYQRTEGYVGATADQLENYYEITHSHKYPLAKIHACICSWDELDGLGKIVSAKKGKDVDFKNMDAEFIVNMLSILGIDDNKLYNQSNVDNVLIKL